MVPRIFKTITLVTLRRIERVTDYRFKILGTSLKKLDRSTSFFVADQEMLYENRYASIAWLSGMLRPPKKKKLRGKVKPDESSRGESSH
jgi:hypothetical protein